MDVKGRGGQADDSAQGKAPAGRRLLCWGAGMRVTGQPQSKKKLERKRDARQKLQEEHGGRNRCHTQNPPRAARIAIKNSHILD